ncbi:helix-turn-helix domain-containing protein [Fulvivirga sediminis]|uniref:Helix-turn-helix domain-containing protein n=1 Tax=Fulvivirga sediminis TaxID=2803949 RepID=A0A937F4B2_9BACT|nr:helix-turn-helix domain-containing protein [Fulvivirga sediminis]MBL3655475.1 helix-turn-helix domain-containing protein [Fulvivirga sediminis]
MLISLYRLQPQESQPPAYSTQLDEFIELIESHIHEHKQVSYYADRLHLSNYQLNHITKKMLNKTASEIINEHIILEAKKYLITTPMQVNEIAYLLGYQDPSYFIRFFKKHTHHSPEMFRKNYPEVLPY